MKNDYKSPDLSEGLHPPQLISHQYLRLKRWLAAGSSAQETDVEEDSYHFLPTTKDGYPAEIGTTFTRQQVSREPHLIVRRQALPQNATKLSTTGNTALSHSTPTSRPSSTLSSPTVPASNHTQPNLTQSSAVPLQSAGSLPNKSGLAPSATTQNQASGPTNSLQTIRPNATIPLAGSALPTQSTLPVSNFPTTSQPTDVKPTFTSSQLSPSTPARPTSVAQPSNKTLVHSEPDSASLSTPTPTPKPKIKPAAKSPHKSNSGTFKNGYFFIGLACGAVLLFAVLGVIIYKIRASRRQQRSLMHEGSGAAANLHATYWKEDPADLHPPEAAHPSATRQQYDMTYPPLPPPPLPLPIPPLPRPSRTARREVNSYDSHSHKPMAFNNSRSRPPAQPRSPQYSSYDGEQWNHKGSSYEADNYYNEPDSPIGRQIDTRYTVRAVDYNVMQPEDRPYDPRLMVNRRGQLRYETEEERFGEENRVTHALRDQRVHLHEEEEMSIYEGSRYSDYSTDRVDPMHQAPPQKDPVPVVAETSTWFKQPFGISTKHFWS